MVVLFKNRDENYKIFYGVLLKSYPTYCDIIDYKDFKGKSDWKHTHIKSVGNDDVYGIYDDMEHFKKCLPELFLI